MFVDIGDVTNNFVIEMREKRKGKKKKKKKKKKKF